MYGSKENKSQKSSVELEREKLLDGLKGIDSAFKLSDLQPGDAGIKKKEYDTRTLDDIKEQAVALLSDYANTSKKAIEGDYVTQKKALNDEITNQKESEEERKSDVARYVKDAKQQTSDDALKRGLARSSIVINQLNAFDNKQIEEFKKIDEDIAKNVSKLEGEISLLEQKRQNALDNFDITYAVKLNEKISQLSSEVQKYNDEVLEYNNKIAEQERAYNDKLKSENDERNREVYEFLDEYGGNAFNDRLNSYRADYVMDYLDSLPKEDAIAVIEGSREIKIALGDNYGKVISYFKNKEK